MTRQRYLQFCSHGRALPSKLLAITLPLRCIDTSCDNYDNVSSVSPPLTESVIGDQIGDQTHFNDGRCIMTPNVKGNRTYILCYYMVWQYESEVWAVWFVERASAGVGRGFSPYEDGRGGKHLAPMAVRPDLLSKTTNVAAL